MSLSKFVDDRLAAFQRTPEMWGSQEALELQALLLIELEFLPVAPPRRHWELYTQELRRLGCGSSYLCSQGLPMPEFVSLLCEAINKVRAQLRSETREGTSP